MQQQSASFKKFFQLSFLLPALALVILTFSNFNPEFSFNIDPALSWLFNYIFDKDPSLGQHIIFPHGPLAFLMYPLAVGKNLFLAIAFMAIVKCTVFYLLEKIFSGQKNSILIAFLLCFIFFTIFDILLLMFIIIPFCFTLWLKTSEKKFIYPAIIIASIALFVRASVGITSLIAVIMFLICILYDERKLKSILKPILIWLLSVITIWLLLFHSFNGFINYIIGWFYLSKDNSAAAAYYPNNNWSLLSVCILSLLVIPFIQHKKNIYVFCAFFFPILFAQWKYSMARQDIVHGRVFFFFMIIYILLLYVILDRKRNITLLLAGISCLTYYMNLPNVYGYAEMNKSFFTVNPLNNVRLHYDDLKKQWNENSLKNVAENKLPNDMLATIGKSTVDVYPWDYTIVPLNNLNLQIRPVVQSYAAYQPWLDALNAKHFAGASAPEYFIWQLNKVTTDKNGGKFESLDNRYLLNDEPQTMMVLLSKYEFVQRNEKFMLWKKRKQPLDFKNENAGEQTVHWNEWIKVPAYRDGISRVAINIKSNFKGKLKSFLYKDEETYMLFRCSNGEQYCYKIVPANAADGVWINPLIIHPENDLRESPVTEFMLVNSDVSKMQNNITLKFMHHYMSDEMDSIPYVAAFSLFGKDKSVSNDFIISSFNNMTNADSNWTVAKTEMNQNDFISSPYSAVLNGNSYSTSFKLNIDSTLIQKTENDFLEVSAGVWLKIKKTTDASLVVTVEVNGQTLLWQNATAKDFAIADGDWNYVYLHCKIPKSMWQPGAKIIAYAWNNSRQNILMDDFVVKVK